MALSLFNNTKLSTNAWLCHSGRILRLSLIRHSLYAGVVEKPPPPPLTGEQYSSSRNTLRVVTARVFYILRVFLTSPFILINSGEKAAPFNVVNHPRCCEPRN